MISVKVVMKTSREPLKRTPVALRFDTDGSTAGPVYTDRAGIARFELPPATGQILVSGVERYHGRLEGEVLIELWSLSQGSDDSRGNPGEFPSGSNAYAGMTVNALRAAGREILTDGEGYLVNPDDWSEDFAREQAHLEGLALESAHWEVIRYLRAYYAHHGRQASVRDMVRHFREIWGPRTGSSRYLHRLFPRGGPQKQGNRLAGLLRTKGEH